MRVQPMAIPVLILFTEGLDVRLAVRIEEFLAALLPRSLELRGRDVPVRPAFPGNGAQILAEVFHSGTAEEPVAVVDLVNDETGLEDNHMRNHGIVDRISVFGDVEIFLDYTPRVGEERPVGTDSAAIFIRQSDIVGANRDKPAIATSSSRWSSTSPSACRRSLGQKPPRLRTRTIGCCPCSSESFRRFAVWSENRHSPDERHVEAEIAAFDKFWQCRLVDTRAPALPSRWDRRVERRKCGDSVKPQKRNSSPSGGKTKARIEIAQSVRCLSQGRRCNFNRAAPACAAPINRRLDEEAGDAVAARLRQNVEITDLAETPPLNIDHARYGDDSHKNVLYLKRGPHRRGASTRGLPR